jgi:hypothetical protein
VPFNEHLDQRFGMIGTLKRTEFEIKAKAFAIWRSTERGKERSTNDSGMTCPKHSSARVFRFKLKCRIDANPTLSIISFNKKTLKR